MKLIKTSEEQLVVELANEADTVLLGSCIGKTCVTGVFVIYLQGDLGAGKTTLSRGIVRAFGYQGAVKSPTYTLVEPYELETQNIYHFDLYRLASAEELHYLGIEDYFRKEPSLCLVEWPEKGGRELQPADWLITLDYQREGRCITIAVNPASVQRAVAVERMTALNSLIDVHCE